MDEWCTPIRSSSSGNRYPSAAPNRSAADRVEQNANVDCACSSADTAASATRPGS